MLGKMQKVQLNDPKFLQNNPGLAKALVKHLSVFELMEITNRGDYSRYNFIMNQSVIIDGILESKESGKILFLAASSSLGNIIEGATFRELFAMGDEFRIALYGNVNFDWYGAIIWQKNNEVTDQIMKDIINENRNFKLAIYQNPRMDRSLIASIIAGRNSGRTSKNLYDFSLFSLFQRIEAAEKSLPVSEIPSEIWKGKDMPDSNEMYFSAPYSAAVTLARDLIAKRHEQGVAYNGAFFNPYLARIENLYLNTDDWLTEDDIKNIDEQHLDFSIRHPKLMEAAFVNFVKFLQAETDNIASNLSQNKSTEYGADLIYFMPSAMAITIIQKVLESYHIRDKALSFIKIMIKSENWVLRAASYVWLFQKIDVRKDLKILWTFFETFSADRDAFFHAIWNSDHTAMIGRYDHAIISELQSRIDSADFDPATLKFFLEESTYLYSSTYDQIDDDQFAKIFQNRMLKANDGLVLDVITNIGDEKGSSRNQGDTSPPVNGTHEIKDVAFSLGRFVGKLIK